MRILFDTMMATSQRALDALAVANETIADNIANVDTPGFKAAEVTFQEELAEARDRELMARSPTRRSFGAAPLDTVRDRFALDDVAPRVVKQAGGAVRRDGNNVDIDREMTAIVQTSTLYSALAQLLASKFGMIAAAIRWSE